MTSSVARLKKPGLETTFMIDNFFAKKDVELKKKVYVHSFQNMFKYYLILTRTSRIGQFLPFVLLAMLPKKLRMITFLR